MARKNSGVDKLAGEFRRLHNRKRDSEQARRARSAILQQLVREIDRPLRQLCSRFWPSVRSLGAAGHLDIDDLLQEVRLHLIQRVLPTWCESSSRFRPGDHFSFSAYAMTAAARFLISILRRLRRELATVVLDDSPDFADERSSIELGGVLDGVVSDPSCPRAYARRLRKEGFSLAEVAAAVHTRFGINWSLATISRLARADRPKRRANSCKTFCQGRNIN